MRQKLGIAIGVAVGLMLLAGLGGGTNTGYEVFRTVKAAEDTQLTAATQQTAANQNNDGTVYAQIPSGVFHVIFLGTDAANETLSWTLWAYKSGSSPAEYAAHGTATTGLTQTGGDSEFYCDTIAITDQRWITTLAVVNGAPDTIVSGGGIAKLLFDGGEYQFFKIVIRDIAGGGAEAAKAGAKIANFY